MNRRNFLKNSLVAANCSAVAPLSVAAAPEPAAGSMAISDNIARSGGTPKPLRLAVEVLLRTLVDPTFVSQLENSFAEYDVQEIYISGFRQYEWLNFPDYPQVHPTITQERISALRRQFQRFKDKGIKVIASGNDAVVPPDFFEVYPEARNAARFWKLVEDHTAQLFHQIPEFDAWEVYLWESNLTNDHDVFSALSWDQGVKTYPLYSPADLITEFVAACSRGAGAAGKEFILLTFSHFPWQEDLVIQALRQAPKGGALRLTHKSQPGDWDPFRLVSNVMLNITDRKARLLFDGVGEYWGQSLMPYCFPEEIQQRVRYALDHNPSIETLGMRIIWVYGRVFGSFNEINLYALAQLARDPHTPIEQIWQTWAEKRFGKQAAPRVISALMRTNEIGNRFYYIRGAWVHSHSALSDLAYLESHVVNYSRSTIQWNPSDFRTKALLEELLDSPREHTIEWVVADRQEALRLNGLSIEDVEAVKGSLPAPEYEKLIGQLTLQRHFIETSIPHIEAFLRYWIQKKTPSSENLRKLGPPLAALEKKADEIERIYQEKMPLLTAKDIRSYAREVRDAVASLKA